MEFMYIGDFTFCLMRIRASVVLYLVMTAMNLQIMLMRFWNQFDLNNHVGMQLSNR